MKILGKIIRSQNEVSAVMIEVINTSEKDVEKMKIKIEACLEMAQKNEKIMTSLLIARKRTIAASVSIIAVGMILMMLPPMEPVEHPFFAGACLVSSGITTFSISFFY